MPLCTSFQWCIWICVLETWGSATQLVGLAIVHIEFGSVLQTTVAGPPSNALCNHILGPIPFIHGGRRGCGDLLTTRAGLGDLNKQAASGEMSPRLTRLTEVKRLQSCLVGGLWSPIPVSNLSPRSPNLDASDSCLDQAVLPGLKPISLDPTS